MQPGEATPKNSAHRKGEGDDPHPTGRPYVSIAGRRVPMPRSRIARIASGVLLILLGLVGFLPVLGFWMVPVGLFILSYDVPAARRLRRRVEVWWARRREKGRKDKRL